MELKSRRHPTCWPKRDRHTLNWCHDDRPQRMRTRNGQGLWAVPWPQELNDTRDGSDVCFTTPGAICHHKDTAVP